MPGLGETLEQIVIINAEGLLILQTIAATAEDRRRGRRRTRTETVSGDALTCRLGELVPALCQQDDADGATAR